MSTSRRGFLGRLFGGAVAAAVPPSWYLRQGRPVPVPVPAAPVAGLQNWTPIDPGKYNAKFIACAEHIDAFLTERAKRPSMRYNPDTFKFAVEAIEHTGVKVQ